jgi:hypothetical protein
MNIIEEIQGEKKIRLEKKNNLRSIVGKSFKTHAEIIGKHLTDKTFKYRCDGKRIEMAVETKTINSDLILKKLSDKGYGLLRRYSIKGSTESIQEEYLEDFYFDLECSEEEIEEKVRNAVKKFIWEYI